jgi:CheY-like chemotaxis protein
MADTPSTTPTPPDPPPAPLPSPPGIQTPPILILCTDLLFVTKITGTAKALGRPVRVLRSTEKLQEELRAHAPPPLLIVDLNAGGPDPLAAIRLAKAHAVPVAAYLSHVQVELAAAAREAGAEKVMARSAFVTQLPAIMGGPGRE